MRRAAVDVPWIALTLAAAIAGCDQGSAPSAPRGSGTAGSEARMSRARREMGLSEALGRDADDEDEDDRERVELTFELGPERLPELPTDLDPEVPPLRDGLSSARDALALARPEPEPGWDDAAFRRFVAEDYARWLRARGEALRAARTALSDAERGELGEHVVASAVIGVMFARFAEAIATMPLPTAIEAREGDRLRFRDAFLRTAAPLFDRAADAFGSCASASVGADDRSLGGWQRFCDEALQRAQEAPRPLD